MLCEGEFGALTAINSSTSSVEQKFAIFRWRIVSYALIGKWLYATIEQIDGLFMTLMHLCRNFRLRAASALVVLYALCLLAPAAAFAFGDGTKAAHCLTDDNHGLGNHSVGASHAPGNEHGHDDATAHKHSDDGDRQQTQSGDCCGLFCLSALAPSADLTFAQSDVLASVPSVTANSILGRG